MRSVVQTVQCRIAGKSVNDELEKDAEEKGGGQFQCTNLVFAWSDWENHEAPIVFILKKVEDILSLTAFLTIYIIRSNRGRQDHII